MVHADIIFYWFSTFRLTNIGQGFLTGVTHSYVCRGQGDTPDKAKADEPHTEKKMTFWRNMYH